MRGRRSWGGTCKGIWIIREWKTARGLHAFIASIDV